MESMKDYEKELEESYKVMGDGETTTDEMLAWRKAEEYRVSKEILTLEVTGIVNKGVIVQVEGLRGFVPASRLDLKRIDDLNEWLGKTVRVRVITVDQKKNKLVLSAREILREERDAKLAAKRDAVQVGSVLEGTVETLKEYGAFVDLGDGVSGLVHVSQISTEHIKHPGVVLSEGQKVRVKVIGKKDGKISLSIRALDEEKKKKEEERVTLPKSEEIGTSLGDILKGLNL